eukprot:m.65588 g.65588  ORF g.65588 m.65588 type:complete len:579 (+) comp13676_c1_seq2:174-1910(+)
MRGTRRLVASCRGWLGSVPRASSDVTEPWCGAAMTARSCGAPPWPRQRLHCAEQRMASSASSASSGSAGSAGEHTKPHQHVKQRKQQLHDLAADHGVTLYPNVDQSGGQTSIAAVRDAHVDTINPGEQSQHVVHLQGRITAKRAAGAKLIFYDIENITGKIQVVAAENAHSGAPFRPLHRALGRGDIVGIQGNVGKTKLGELSVFANTTTLLAPCLHDIPTALKDPEARVRHRHVDMLVNDTLHHGLRVRANVLAFIREFLDARSFLEVETPILSGQAGGAAARPFVTQANTLGQDVTLRIAPELFLKRLVIGGCDRVYEIGKQFRNEGVDAMHNPEFTSCEFYQAYAGFEDLVQTTEELVCGLVHRVTGGSVVTVHEPDSELEIDFGTPFRRVDFLDALSESLGGIKLPDLDDEDALDQLEAICKTHGIAVQEPRTVGSVLDRMASVLVEPRLVQPTLLCGHPLCISPLAKARPQDDRLAERFELFVAGHELCNAYVELNDPHEQRSRFKQQAQARQAGDDEAHEFDAGYCEALEYGLPPTVGWGMGIDRVVMLLANATHIRDVLPFPLLKDREEPS